MSLATGTASITFDFTDGGALVLAIQNGLLLIDGRPVGRSPEGGALELPPGGP